MHDIIIISWSYHFAFVCAAVSDKVALVIGNQQYECEKLQGLVYSEKDAFDVAQALSELGFKVRIPE